LAPPCPGDFSLGGASGGDLPAAQRRLAGLRSELAPPISGGQEPAELEEPVAIKMARSPLAAAVATNMVGPASKLGGIGQQLMVIFLVVR